MCVQSANPRALRTEDEVLVPRSEEGEEVLVLLYVERGERKE